MKIFIFVCFLIKFLIINSKIVIFTYSYNRPDFIEIQYETLKRFLKEDFEFVVFNDAINSEVILSIESICKKLEINCVKIPQEIHVKPYLKRMFPYQKLNHPTVRNCNVVQWSLDNFGFEHDDILVLLDSDIFLIKEFPLRDLIKDYDLITWLKPCTENHKSTCQKVHPQIDPIKYCWIGLIILNMKTLPNKKTFNVNCGNIKKVAVSAGGFTYNYIKENPFLKVLSVDRFCLDNLKCNLCNDANFSCLHIKEKLEKLNFDTNVIDFIQNIPFTKKRNSEFFYNNTFFHYRAGTNYFHENAGFIKKKSQVFLNFINNVLEKSDDKKKLCE